MPGSPSILLTYAPRPLRALLSGRGIWALSDQALLSLGNFLTNILLIRHLDRDDFGNFAVLFSVILFLNNLHSSLVTYPLSITASADDDATLASRTRGAIAIALILAIPFAAIAAAATLAVASAAVIPWVVAAMILWQLQETLRRAMMARLQHHRAMPGDALSYLGQVAAIVFLAHIHQLTLPHAFGVIAATSALAALIQTLQLNLLKTGVLTSGEHVSQSLTQQSHHYWSLGRWVLLSNLIGLVTVYATPWILRYFHGPGEVATYQALSNLLGVSNPVVASMAGLIVPAVAKAKSESDLPPSPRTRGEGRGEGDFERKNGSDIQNQSSASLHRAAKAAAKYGAQGLCLLLPYYALLMIAPHTALTLFYGHASPYLAFAPLLRLIVLVYALYYLSQVAFGFLNGLGHSLWSFYAQLCAAVANAIICLPLAITVGMVGAIYGGVVPMLAQLAVAAIYVKALFSHPRFPAAIAVPRPLEFETIPEGVP